jgi:hypothetical protein
MRCIHHHVIFQKRLQWKQTVRLKRLLSFIVLNALDISAVQGNKVSAIALTVLSQTL